MMPALVLLGACGRGATPPGAPLPHVFDAAHVLVVPSAAGVQLYDSNAEVVATWSWDAIVGPCGACLGEGASADGDGLLVAWAGIGENRGFARVDADGATTALLSGLGFPHEAVRDPADDTILVLETWEDAVHWYPPDAGDRIVRALDADVPGWQQSLPNGAELVEHGERRFLVISNRGTGGTTPGLLTCWDITTPGEPVLQWTFPATGSLDTPHGPVVRRWAGATWLLYAHSYGGPDGGSVGVARLDDPTAPPAYVADLVLAPPDGRFAFLRGVELTSDGRLWLTDSGPEPGVTAQGAILEAAFPALDEAGASGAEGDQVFVELSDVSVFAENLENPFEGWLWARPAGGAL